VCQAIASGDDVDVLEIDGASNRGIEEIRELRQNAHFRPTRCRYKIYIIDEVHMLTREAFNALLKTLEEPPSHVKFIFATTDPQKIPATILSRCQRFDFGGIAPEKMQACLDHIVSAEGIAVDEDAVELVVRRAAGSMRDAQSLLDQLLAFGGERVTAEQVRRLLGTLGEDRLIQLVGQLLAHDPAQVFAELDTAEGEGVQLDELLDQMIGYFRDLMVSKTAGAAWLVSVAQRHRETLVQQAAAVSLETILAAMDILAEAKSRIRGTNYGRMMVELALVRIASLEDLMSIAELAERLAGVGATAAPVAPARAPAAPVAPARAPAAPVAAPRPPAAAAPKKNEIADPQPARPPVAAPQVAPQAAEPVTATALPQSPAAPAVPPTESAATSFDVVQIVDAAIAELPPLVADVLRRAQVERSDDGAAIVVRLGEVYNTPARQRQIESALQARAGGGIRIRFDLTSEPAGSAGGPTRKRSSADEALRDPLVVDARDVLGARVVRVDR
jgi:DNA polymerase-3 subunit gamma/tau